MSRRATCPTAGQHFPGQPAGYAEWFEWAAGMQRTHTQRRCPGCNLYAVWVPRGTDEEPEDGRP